MSQTQSITKLATDPAEDKNARSPKKTFNLVKSIGGVEEEKGLVKP